MSGDPLVLGVDAGGTKTLAWLATAAGEGEVRPLGTGQAGPGNPRAVGFELALHRIEEAVLQAFRQAGREPHPVSGLCVAMAGAGRSEEQQRVQEWCLSRKLAERVLVCGDAEPVLAAASPDFTGVALISGTGSFCWGRNARGETARAGGWGYLFGDEGSAYRIALEGLRAATQGVDGVGPETELTTRFMQELGVDRPQGFIEAIYGRNLSRDQIASLARVVFALAESDQIARKVLDQALKDLAGMVRGVERSLKISLNMTVLGIAGGVFTNQKRFRESLSAYLELDPCRVCIIESPVSGAVTLAKRL